MAERKSLTSREYWLERSGQREAAIWKKAGVFESAVEKNAARTIDEITKDVRALYARYAKQEGITLADAYTELNATEMKGIRSRLKSLYREFNKSGDAGIMREISRLSMKSRINRFEELALSMNASVSRMAGANIKIVEDAVGRLYKESRLRTRFDVAKAVGYGDSSLATVDAAAVAKMVKMPLWAKNFSAGTPINPLWTNKAALISTLQRTLTQALAGGYSVDRATGLFRLGVESSRSAALRVVRTEIAYAQEEAVREEYEDFGFENYIFVATLDDRTSEICGSLDGESFPTKDAQAGVNYPPMHPNCFHPDAEVLTDEGFRRFDELMGKERFWSMNPETGAQDWARAKKKIETTADSLINFRHASFALSVTAGHKMVVKYGKNDGSGKFRFVDADRLPKWNNSIPRGVEWRGADPDLIDFAGRKVPAGLLCKFFAWYLSDGSTTKISGKNSFRVSISQETHGELMFRELSALPFSITKTAGKINCYDFEVGRALYEFGKCNRKYVPAYIKNLSPRLLSIFLDAYSIADGHTKKNKPFGEYIGGDQRSFFTTSKRLADDLAEIIAKAGKRPSIHISKAAGRPCFGGKYRQNFDLYIVRECSTLNASVSTIEREIVKHGGPVYCVELEKWNTLFVKFDGQVCWAGNCRSTTIPDVGSAPANRVARDLESGDSYSMDQYKTYEEWAAVNL